MGSFGADEDKGASRIVITGRRVSADQVRQNGRGRGQSRPDMYTKLQHRQPGENPQKVRRVSSSIEKG